MIYPEGQGEKGEGGVMQGGYYSKADPTPIPLPSGYSSRGPPWARCFTITVVTLHIDAPWHRWHSGPYRKCVCEREEGERERVCGGATRVVRHIINFKSSGHPNRGSLLLGNSLTQKNIVIKHSNDICSIFHSQYYSIGLFLPGSCQS